MHLGCSDVGFDNSHRSYVYGIRYLGVKETRANVRNTYCCIDPVWELGVIREELRYEMK